MGFSNFELIKLMKISGDKGSDKNENRPSLIGLLALFGGAAAISLAPVFVRLSETGPTATAFYRIFFAQPIVWGYIIYQQLNPNPKTTKINLPSKKWWPWFVLAGVMFALDMGFWHKSIHLTTLANSTLIANAAPLFVVLGARFFFKEKIHPVYGVILITSSIGMVMLVKANFSIGGKALIGDACALTTAFFYGGYQLCVKYLRNQKFGPVIILSYSGISAYTILLIAALFQQEQFAITQAKTIYALLGLALISHVGGQGLIVYAFGHLPASLASIGLLLQPVMVIILGWFIANESMDLIQIIGACILLISLYFATHMPPVEHEKEMKKTES